MATYYVRKSGSDAAAGTSAGAAWLTIDKAANTVAAGDTVYIGAGVYRELVTMDTSGTSGNLIKYIADVTGAYTGDGGIAIISAYDTNTGSPARSYCLIFNDKQFIEWQDVVFYGGSANNILDANTGTNLAYEGVTFNGCVFISNRIGSDTVYFDFNTGATPATTGLTFDGCFFWCVRFRIVFDNHASAAQNFKTVIKNSTFLGYYDSVINIAFWIQRNTDNSFKSGGFSLHNCTIMGANTGVVGSSLDSTTYPVDIKNCLIARCPANGIERSGGTSGSIVSDYNTFTLNGTNVSGVTIGANSKAAGEYFLWGGLADLPLYRRLGWSPYKPWEPITGSGLIGNGTTSSMPTTDLYGNPRPMGRSTHDVGAVEANTQPTQNSTDEYEGAYCMELSGAGFFQFWQPVEAASTTITVQAKYDSNYTGTKPQLVVTNIPGVADQTDTVAGSSGSYELLSLTFTPTSAGFVRVKLVSSDTSATGKAFFDDLQVT